MSGQHAHGIETGSDHVLAWSTTRLPFEPRGDMRVFRDELRAAISRLNADDDQGLLATYSSPLRAFGDVENILIYNVGASAFKNASRTELAFQRSFEQEGLHEHTYRYEILQRPIRPGPDTEPVARWRSSKLDRLSESTGLPSLWWLIRNGEIEVIREIEAASPVRIELEVRAPRPINLASVVKVAVDASIAALQEPQLKDPSEPVRRIASLLAVPAPQVEAALLDPQNRVFSQGPVVRLRGDSSVHWNPADDNCIAGVVRYAPSTEWELRGELFRF